MLVTARFGIIGSGDRLRREVQHAFQDNIRFGFNQPNLYAARAFIVSTVVSSLYQQSPVSDTVGGLYQVIRLSSPYDCEEYYMWPTDDGWFDKITWERDGSNAIIRNLSQNKEIVLTPVWNTSA